MKKSPTFLKIVVVLLIVLIVGYVGIKYSLKKDAMGTWTTQDGSEKLLINNFYLVYIDESSDVKETHLYLVKDFNSEYHEFYLYPSIFNKIGILGMYEKIQYRNGSLFGGILISDDGYYETEFRKEWK